jgi:hypothetical protein
MLVTCGGRVVCGLLGGVKAPPSSFEEEERRCDGWRTSRPATTTTPEARHVTTRPAARDTTLGSPQLRNSTRRLHPPLRAAWSVGAGASIPPRDAKQLLPPVGTGRGGWSRLVGSLRDLVTTRTLQQTSVPKPAPNPANTRETKPQPYAELLGLQPTLPYTWCLAGQAATLRVRHWVEGYDLVHIQ